MKKLIVLLLLFSFNFKGDINQDYKVNANDAELLSKYLAELVELTPQQIRNADMNNDGVIDILDLAILARR